MTLFTIKRANSSAVLPTLAEGESVGCRVNIASADAAGCYAVTAGAGTLASLRADNTNYFEMPVAGWGAAQLWAIGWEAYTVTDTGDSGAGTLRAALESDTAYVITCPTNQYISIESELLVRPNKIVYGNGCTIRHGGTYTGRLLVMYSQYAPHTVYIKNLRIRGVEGGADQACAPVTIYNSVSQPGNIYSIIFDHCSISWAGHDNNVSLGQNGGNSGTITGAIFYRCIISDPLSPHPTGWNATGDPGAGGYANTYQILIDHCLFANCNHRGPLSTTAGVLVCNNVMYNFGGSRLGGVTKGGVCDWINNYFKPGPASKTARLQYRWYDDIADQASIYMSGNYDTVYGSDQWALWKRTDMNNGGTLVDLPDLNKRSTPLDQGNIPPTIESATEAYTSIITGADVGCQPLDSYDVALIQSVINGTGPELPYDTVAAAGGWPVLE